MTILCDRDERDFRPIHVELNGVKFPSEDWDDFAGQILPDWQSVLIQMGDSPCTLWFMDGPYYLLVEPDEGSADRVIVRAMDDHEPLTVVATTKTTREALLAEIRRAML